MFLDNGQKKEQKNTNYGVFRHPLNLNFLAK